MTDQRIAELRALSEKATPGPWRDQKQCDGAYMHIGSEQGGDWVASISLPSGPYYEHKEGRYTEDQQVEINAAFIAAARTALPELLDALEAEREKIRELEQAFNAAMRGMRSAQPPAQGGE